MGYDMKALIFTLTFINEFIRLSLNSITSLREHNISRYLLYLYSDIVKEHFNRQVNTPLYNRYSCAFDLK